MHITVYTFMNADGADDTFTTQDPALAHERGQRYGLLVVANDFEWVDSEAVADYRESTTF